MEEASFPLTRQPSERKKKDLSYTIPGNLRLLNRLNLSFMFDEHNAMLRLSLTEIFNSLVPRC